jgi:bisphosphoglycerate-independent phosphoglycerate mutase (AlkP superfamily)
MLSGAAASVHGVATNAVAQHGLRVPTILHVAQAAAMQTSLLVSKQKLTILAGAPEPDVLAVGGMRCTRITPAAERRLGIARTGVHFIHFAEPDTAGHAYGFMSDRYRAAVRRADGCLGRLVAVLERSPARERTLLIVTSDHGGHGHTHGADQPTDTQIPWIAWGGPPGRARVVARRVETTDTAATVLAALGLPAPPSVTGRAVSEALRGR